MSDSMEWRSGSIAASTEEELPVCPAMGRELGANCAACLLVRAASAGGSARIGPTRFTPSDLYFRSGAVLYREGERGTSLWILRSGIVKLVQHLPNGTERIVRLLRGGDIAGLGVLFHPIFRHTAVAAGPTHVRRIPKLSLSEYRRICTCLDETLIKALARSLETADFWITGLSTGSVAARVARLIQFLREDRVVAPAHCVTLPRRDDMAAMLGVAPESVCRVLSEFQKSGILRRLENGVFELDAAAIEGLARGGGNRRAERLIEYDLIQIVVHRRFLIRMPAV